MKEQPYHLCLEILGNKLRIEVIQCLNSGPKTVSQLVKETDSKQSTISHSLKALKQCRFVESEVRGKDRVYSLCDSFLARMPKGKNLFDVMKNHAEENCEYCRRLEK